MFKLNTSTSHGARTQQHLESDQVAWLTTVDAKGTPQPSPIRFHWDGDTAVIYSQPNSGKLRNIAQNPRVSLSFNCDPNGNDVVILTGTAEVDEKAPPASEHLAYLEKYRDGLASTGMTGESFAERYSVAVRVRPEKLRGF